MSTIVALSTPKRPRHLAVIRLSGFTRNRYRDADGRSARSNRERRSSKVVKDDEIIDEVVLTCFLAPRSLTGEDVVEISCHGSPAVVRQIVDRR